MVETTRITLNRGFIHEVLGTIIGPLILALGLTVFIFPNSLAFGGISGLGVILQKVFGIHPSITNMFPLCLIFLTYRYKGYSFVIKTVLATLEVSALLEYLSPLQTLGFDYATSAIMGGVLMGLGIGLTINAGGSTGGPDSIGLLIEAKFNIAATKTMLLFDMIIIVIGGFLFGTSNMFYSLLLYLIMINTIAKMTTGKFIFYFDVHSCLMKMILIQQNESAVCFYNPLINYRSGAPMLYKVSTSSFNAINGRHVRQNFSRRVQHRYKNYTHTKL